MRSAPLRLFCSLFPLLLPACATTSVVTPVSAWSVPEACASRFRADEYGHVKGTDPLLIRDADELREQVECSPPRAPAYDFSLESIAMFRFASRGGSFKPLSASDDGETVTLVVESHSYCGGTPPPMVTETFFYRVPRRTDHLATRIVPAEEPPCSPNIP
jgi:hypothetical protein